MSFGRNLTNLKKWFNVLFKIYRRRNIYMSESKGLTGINEIARGFVGGKVKFGTTINGRPKIYFDIACGITDESTGHYPTWRHCVLYDNNALELKGLKPGNLVRVSGWVTTEYMLDEHYKPIVDVNTGLPIKMERLICYKGEILNYVKKIKENQLPLAVGQASGKKEG